MVKLVYELDTERQSQRRGSALSIAQSASARPWKELLDFIPRTRDSRESRTVQTLRGRVDRVDGEVAYVTLTDSHGRETYADCAAIELSRRGIDEGALFECRIEDRGTETAISIEPVAERQLSTREWKQISARAKKALADYNPSDDY
jgi:hypothetical protein